MDAQNAEWQAPPPPENIRNEQPEMSEVGTLGNIFFEPGRTFEDLKRKPRFILALLVILILTTIYGLMLVNKVGDDGLRRVIMEQIEKNPQASSMSSEQKNAAVDMQMKISGYTRYATPIFVGIFFALGGLFYWLGAKAFGGTGNFLHGLSVFTYSSFAPTVVAMIANLIILFFKAPEDIDFMASQRGVIQANPSMFFDGKAMPVLTTLISVIDFFAIWGWVLAAIGLQKTNRISKGSAWAIVIIIALIGITLRVIGAVFSGNPS